MGLRSKSVVPTETPSSPQAETEVADVVVCAASSDRVRIACMAPLVNVIAPILTKAT